MVLCKKFQVPLPQKGIITRKTTKHQYVYKVLKTYRNQNNQPTNTRTLIGKLDPQTNMLIPNNTYWQHYPNTTPTIINTQTTTDTQATTLNTPTVSTIDKPPRLSKN
ncbi:MAG: hypothetical protein LBQ98_05560 [Nitrososphaerota archaeon]|nr:hypothetical protein [Nitrososphaerota archaeon]